MEGVKISKKLRKLLILLYFLHCFSFIKEKVKMLLLCNNINNRFLHVVHSKKYKTSYEKGFYSDLATIQLYVQEVKSKYLSVKIE